MYIEHRWYFYNSNPLVNQWITVKRDYKDHKKDNYNSGYKLWVPRHTWIFLMAWPFLQIFISRKDRISRAARWIISDRRSHRNKT